MKIDYVNTIIFNEDISKLAYLKKLTGPKFLVNRYNFIGGKVDFNETTRQAAVREVQEEAFVKLNEADLISIYKDSGDDWSLETFCIKVNQTDFSTIKQTASEPIIISEIFQVFLGLQENNQNYSNDFEDFLNMALIAIHKTLA